MKVISRHLSLLLLLLIVLPSCSLIEQLVGSPSNDNSPTYNSDSERVKIGSPEMRARYFLPREDSRLLPLPKREITPEVEEELRSLVAGRKTGLKDSLTNRNRYLPLVEGIFREQGVPPDLLNVAILESGFRNNVSSPMGAVGVWQFMKSTARAYGLTVNLLVDERKDIALSTVAAARHLRDLYLAFGDWSLALAAYNVGHGGVRSIIKKSKQRDFWKLARAGLFKPETVKFVSRFYAMLLIFDHPESFGVDPKLVGRRVPIPAKELFRSEANIQNGISNRPRN